MNPQLCPTLRYISYHGVVLSTDSIYNLKATLENKTKQKKNKKKKQQIHAAYSTVLKKDSDVLMDLYH